MKLSQRVSVLQTQTFNRVKARVVAIYKKGHYSVKTVAPVLNLCTSSKDALY